MRKTFWRFTLSFCTLIFTFSILVFPSGVFAQDPIQSPAGSYGASITSGLAPLQFQQFSLKTFFQEFISIPSAHAQTADIVTGLMGHWKFDPVKYASGVVPVQPEHFTGLTL